MALSGDLMFCVNVLWSGCCGASETVFKYLKDGTGKVRRGDVCDA